MSQRFFHRQLIAQQQFPFALELDSATKHHLNVLRYRIGDTIELIDNSGGFFLCRITKLKQSAIVEVLSYHLSSVESSLDIHLCQIISRGDKMDLTIQKAVELGVKQITPLFSQKCGVTLKADRLSKKMEHWQQVIIAACLQCGRTTIPSLNPAVDLVPFLKHQQQNSDFKLQLDPRSSMSLCQLTELGYSKQPINLLIGSESGLTLSEVELACQAGFHPIKLGPRILRTETAGLTIIAILQALYGDLN